MSKILDTLSNRSENFQMPVEIEEVHTILLLNVLLKLFKKSQQAAYVKLYSVAAPSCHFCTSVLKQIHLFTIN